MMDPTVEQLQEVFNSMSYGPNVVDTSQANVWLQSLEILDKSTDVNAVLDKTKVSEHKITRSHFTKLAQELERNIDLICQIEILSRGILSKDTRQAVEVLVQYFYYYANGLVKTEHSGIVVGIFEDDHPLWLLGLFLAPALSTGHTIVLQTGTKFAAIVTFILELIVKAGIPNNVVTLIASNEGDLQPYLNQRNVLVVSLFVDLLNDKYRGVNRSHKKILVFSARKCPMIVFENADLDSAAEKAIQAAWEYQGMLPWAIDTILVQENVFKTFVMKLKVKLGSIRIGSGDDKMADISYPSNPVIFQRLINCVDQAKRLGIEVFQKATGIPGNNYTPTLIIGSRVNTNNVVAPPEHDATVTVLPFRFIDEAVSLANNTRQGLGASVWSENVGLCNEVAAKLTVGNVWINSHGLFSCDVPLVPLKDSGVGYFGGRQGAFEYQNVCVRESVMGTDSPATLKNVEAVSKAIALGKNASVSWSKTSIACRAKVFGDIVDFMDTNKKQLGEKLPEKWLDSFQTSLEKVILTRKQIGSFHINGYTVTSFSAPRGVVVIEMKDPVESHSINLLLTAVFEGNAVVLLNESVAAQNLYEQVSKKLPSSILTVLSYSLHAAKTASDHKQLNAYFSSHSNAIMGSLPVNESKIFSLVAKDDTNSWELVTTVKNIWSNIGQSHQCKI